MNKIQLSDDIDANDERTNIINDLSPTKQREVSTPLPQINQEKDFKTQEKSNKQIYEYKNFGSGKIDLLSCRFDPDDSLIATGSSDGMINIYAVEGATNKPVMSINGAEYAGTPITGMRWRPCQSGYENPQILVTGCADGNVSHWQTSTGKLLSRIVEPDNQILTIDFNRDGAYFATGGKDRNVRVYDESKGKLLATLSGGFGSPGHSNRVFAVKFHPTEENMIVSGGWDNILYFWDIRAQKSVASIQGPTVSGDALDIKNKHILTGSWRNKDQLELWDLNMRKKLTTIDWSHGENVTDAFIYSCQFSKVNDETIVAGCSNRNEVKIFDRLNDNIDFGKITNLTKGTYSVDYANKSEMYSFCGGDGRVHLIQIVKSSSIKLI